MLVATLLHKPSFVYIRKPSKAKKNQKRVQRLERTEREDDLSA